MSNWGKSLQISIFGESHGAGIGVVLDGLPAGVPIDLAALTVFMSRRAPGRDHISTARREEDLPEILSGFCNGMTTGTPLAALIRNTDTRSADYAEFASEARPGHADFTGFMRYGGHNDLRGGGHFSARLTAPLCFAGGVAKQLLEQKLIFVGAHLARVSKTSDTLYDPVSVDRETLLAPGKKAFPVLDSAAGEQMKLEIEAAHNQLDSVGGVVECAVIGVPSGIGSPMFEGLENTIASMIFGIPAVKGLEFGAGFAAAELRGSENNDPFCVREGRILSETNHAGGILGGISSGMPIVLRVAFKPTPSIAQTQRTVNFAECEPCSLRIKGRHDPCVAVRAVPVVEAAVALAMTDAMLAARGYSGF